jgi:hypothetical protein
MLEKNLIFKTEDNVPVGKLLVTEERSRIRIH